MLVGELVVSAATGVDVALAVATELVTPLPVPVALPQADSNPIIIKQETL